jgi:hypothetical protein
MLRYLRIASLTPHSLQWCLVTTLYHQYRSPEIFWQCSPLTIPKIIYLFFCLDGNKLDAFKQLKSRLLLLARYFKINHFRLTVESYRDSIQPSLSDKAVVSLNGHRLVLIYTDHSATPALPVPCITMNLPCPNSFVELSDGIFIAPVAWSWWQSVFFLRFLPCRRKVLWKWQLLHYFFFLSDMVLLTPAFIASL